MNTGHFFPKRTPEQIKAYNLYSWGHDTESNNEHSIEFKGYTVTFIQSGVHWRAEIRYGDKLVDAIAARFKVSDTLALAKARITERLEHNKHLEANRK